MATLAARLEGRGQHLWLFRAGATTSRGWSSARAPTMQRTAPQDLPTLVREHLKRHCLRLAEYQETDREIWDEVRPLEM